MAVSAGTRRWLAWGVFTVSAVAAVGIVPVRLWLLPDDNLSSAAFNVMFVAVPVVGILIARRQPDNRIAWILLAIGAVNGVGSVAEPYTTYGLVLHPGSLPGAAVVAAINGSLWVPGIGLTGTYLILLFPDGRLPGPRWRPVAWVSGITIGLLVLAFIFSPAQLEQGANVRNPLAIGFLASALPLVLFVLPVLPLCMLACAAGLVTRFRRSRGVERLQVKWLAAAAALVACVYLTLMLLSWAYGLRGEASPPWLDALDKFGVATFVLIPVAIGVAILKHGLYGIDRLISRTLSYSLITGTLLVVYLGVITVVGRLTPGNSSLSVAASTLTVAALFQPLRRRVQAIVDRRFNRARYDADRTVEVFTRRLRDQVDLDAVRTDLLGVVHETLQPASAGLWLRDVTRPLR